MIQINRLKLDIQAVKTHYKQEVKRFGFDIPFKKGLNVIKGENSSGKSTIISCLFYSLCLEEMLGAKYNRSLNNALKDHFTIDEDSYTVISSYVYIEIENSLGKIVTLRRRVDYKKKADSEKFLVKFIEGKLGSNIEPNTLFVHRTGNHHSELGYYKWLSRFLGLDTPTVLNRDGNDIPLYWQTIFPALFIEQVKGWSDFLASTPYFGIQNNKQRTIEFLFNLKSLSNEIEKEKLEKESKEIIKKWKSVIEKINLLAVANSGKVSELPEEPFSDLLHIKEVFLSISLNKGLEEDIEEEEINIEQLISNLLDEQKNIKIIPKFAKDTRQGLKTILKIKEEEYENYSVAYDEFMEKFKVQKNQINSYDIFLKELEKEININKDIEYLTKRDNTINELKTCPTCHQKFGSLVPKTDFNLEFKTIKGNLEYLKNQKKLLKSSIKNLAEIIEKKELINTSFVKEMSLLRIKITQMKNELLDPDMMPSRTQIYEKIKLEDEVKNLIHTKETFELLKGELEGISEQFATNKADLDKLSNILEEDKIKLNAFELDFKDLLNKFHYTSNDIFSISIQKQTPFKYFPVIKYGDDIQKIQLGSSASGFVRSIWAYTVALLKQSENHPGIILFDEPSQHSMNSKSLIGLFTVLSELKNHQIIVAASTDEYNKTEDKKPYSIDNILEGLDYNQYVIKGKSIQEIKS